MCVYLDVDPAQGLIAIYHCYIFFSWDIFLHVWRRKKKDTNIYMKVVRDPDITCPELIRTSEMTFRFSVFQIVHEFPVLVGFQGCFLCGSGDC